MVKHDRLLVGKGVKMCAHDPQGIDRAKLLLPVQIGHGDTNCELGTGSRGRLPIMRLSVLLLVLVSFVVTQKTFAQYAVNVNLPECDYIIRSASDWKKVNDPAYAVICVAPGIYTYKDIGVVELRRSGTAEHPRYLRWYDPAQPGDIDTHVVDIPPRKQAVIPQFKLMADYWVIDRIVMRGGRHQNTLAAGASHNVLNRILIEGGTATLLLRFLESSHNVLQHSVLRNTVAIPGRDSYAIYFDRSESERIVDNEIYNYGGGIQQSPLSLNNHVVYGNEMYITDELYTDCRGHRDKQGECMCSEGMAVVLKGVNRPGTTFRIENNLIYGHRRHDELCMGSGTPGVAIDLGSGGSDTRNVIIKGNILLNRVPNNIYTGLHVGDVEITGNVIGYGEYGITNLYGDNMTITDNLYIDNAKDYHTGRKAVFRTTYNNNRKITDSEKAEMCFQVKKFTAPHLSCVSDLQ